MTDAELDALLVRAFGPLTFGELVERRAQLRQALADYEAWRTRAAAEYEQAEIRRQRERLGIK